MWEWLPPSYMQSKIKLVEIKESKSNAKTTIKLQNDSICTHSYADVVMNKYKSLEEVDNSSWNILREPLIISGKEKEKSWWWGKFSN